jgi:pimeloyl-ACP methyl ester carboxylesterase
VPILTTDVLDIAYTEPGPAGAEPVLLLHGWPDCPAGWSPVAAGLAASGRRVIMPANRGTGGTRFRRGDTVRDGQAVALAQDVLDLTVSLGLDRFAVVGHDWGARVAYTLAALAPTG